MKHAPKIKTKFKKFSVYLLKFIFIASFLFLLVWFNSKETSFNVNKLSRKEKKDLNVFLEYLLLREGGIYVLFGNKPIVFSSLCIISRERLRKNSENIPAIIKEKANRCKIKLKFKIEGWEKVQKHFKIKGKYLLFFKKHEEAGIADVYFINKANLISVLNEYYDIFKKRIDFDFDPLTIINEFNEDNSKFWSLVQRDIVLQGLIFGYGKTNSLLFEQWLKTDQKNKQTIEKLGFYTANNHLVDANIKVNYQNFPLPVFRSFPNDVILEKYKKERQKIIALYRGRDPLKVTIEKLCE
ncbi:MAG: hypothetical protein K1060chlam1_00355 [Candidatus Anoxychlamydiales bacterium]|nr:hypothetical protein [Candidatus Anoxychlamydiales bacterium]